MTNSMIVGRRRSLVGVMTAFGVALAMGACGGDDDSAELANPAAEYCVEQGGTLESIEEAGGTVSYCTLPDGRRVEEWELFRASHPGLANPAAVFCEERGGTTSGPEPMCTLGDGTVVDAWEYFREHHG